MTVNSSEPDRAGDISATVEDGVVFNYQGRSSANWGYPTTGYPAGTNITWAVNTANFFSLYLGAGVSFDWSTYSSLASNLGYAFKDQITLPAGDYELDSSYAPYGNVVGTVAWVENDATATRLGPIISTNSSRQVTYSRFRFSSNTQINIALRILTGRGNSGNNNSILSICCTIRKL